MDLLLTHGYFLVEDAHERKIMRPHPPLGILYLSSYLKKKGFQVEIYDSTFSTRESFRGYIRRTRPPVVGLYCNLMTRQSVLDLVRVCRIEGSHVLVGGPEPANYAEEFLERGVDVVVVGEAELTLEEILLKLAAGNLEAVRDVTGIVYRDGAQIVRNPPREFIQDLDSQPLPDRGAIDLQRYFDTWKKYHGVSVVSLITSRGCPYKCTWCSHSVFGYSHRLRSPKVVADEVQTILREYRPDMLWYADDVFTLNHRWFFELAHELRQRKLQVPFEAISREDRLNEEVIRVLAEIGCQRLWIGSESGSQKVIDSMQRQTNVRQVREKTRLLQQHGIETGMFIMLGYEGEEIEDIRMTVEHLKSSNPNIFLTTVAYPIKGTPYFDLVADRVFRKKPWSRSSDRDLLISSRPPQVFYRFASRWIAGEVASHKLRSAGPGKLWDKAKAYVNLVVGKLGVWALRGTTENG